MLDSNYKGVVGFTTGVYDLFHIGHLNLLRKAKQHCDYLIVGVTTDELSELKKNKRPVISFEERAEIVSCIKFVDEVHPQVHYDKMAHWEQHRFHKMFVGDDWKGSPEWLEHERKFSEVGVEIVYFPYTGHVSTSHLRSSIHKTG